jgi:hypothetical protein
VPLTVFLPHAVERPRRRGGGAASRGLPDPVATATRRARTSRSQKEITDVTVEVLLQQNAVLTTAMPNVLGKARVDLGAGSYRIRGPAPVRPAGRAGAGRELGRSARRRVFPALAPGSARR